MTDETNGGSSTTRREYVKYGSAIVGGGLVAGCLGGSDSDPETDTGAEATATETATAEETTTTAAGKTPTATEETATETSAEEASSPETPYSVYMEPMGEVTFESVPEAWMAYFSNYGDMAIALGQLDGLEGLVFTENWPLEFYDHLPDVDVSFDDVPQLMGANGLDKEAFYEMNADVHLMDPNFIGLLADDWERKDFREIGNNVGPIVGNTIRRRGEDWHDYTYYSLYEAFETVATVFRERERYRAIEKVHDDLISTVVSKLPDEEDRPTVGLLSVNSNFEKGAFYAYPVHGGNGHKQYRDIRMRGAFDDAIEGGYAKWDYEQILEVDPDALLFQYGFSHVPTEEFERRMDLLRDDPVGGQLTAVRNDRLYRGGTSYQGPIINLFQTEAAAKQFYPDTFGEWNGLETLANEDERLFDYQRVADIINGAI